MVAISHKYQFIYIKTIKTAGTSIEMFLEPLCTPPGHEVTHYHPTIVSDFGIIGRRSKVPFKRIRKYFEPWYNHMPARQIRRRLGAEKFDSYFKISSIRNPYDLAISLFYETAKMRGKSVPPDPYRRKVEFQNFISGRWTNQLPLLTVGDQMCVDRFVRFENISEDLWSIIEEVGADPLHLNLYHAKQNMKRSRNLTDYYDKKSAEKVRDHMGWVFDRFNYSEEVPYL